MQEEEDVKIKEMKKYVKRFMHANEQNEKGKKGAEEALGNAGTTPRLNEKTLRVKR